MTREPAAGRVPSTMNAMVSVIVPTYNRREILRQVLASLRDQQPTAAGEPVPPFEVIVVDDGSTDGTAQMLSELGSVSFPLRVVSSPHRGPGPARNLGVAAAQAPLLLFIDSDLIAGPQLVASHYAAQQAAADRIVHGPVIQVHTLDVSEARQTPARLADRAHAFFATGNVSIARRHLVAAGGFDEGFAGYGWEDLELGERLRRLGLVATWVQEARGYHYKPPWRVADLPELCRREQERARNAMLFYRRYPTRRVRWMIPLHPITFALERLINLGGWPQWPAVRRWLVRQESARPSRLWRFVLWATIQHAYFEALRREWDSHRRDQSILRQETEPSRKR